MDGRHGRESAVESACIRFIPFADQELNTHVSSMSITSAPLDPFRLFLNDARRGSLGVLCQHQKRRQSAADAGPNCPDDAFELALAAAAALLGTGIHDTQEFPMHTKCFHM